MSKKERQAQAEATEQAQIVGVAAVSDDEVQKLLAQAAKQKEYHAKYNLEHKDQIRDYHRRYNAENKKELTEEQKAKQKAYHAKYNKDHAEKVKEYHTEYNKARREALAIAKAAAKAAEGIAPEAENAQ